MIKYLLHVVTTIVIKIVAANSVLKLSIFYGISARKQVCILDSYMALNCISHFAERVILIVLSK